MTLLRYATGALLISYLVFGAFALAVAIIDPGDDPLSAVFLVIAAMPWTLPIGWLLDRLAEPPTWLSYALTLAGILANALLLYGLVRLTRHRLG
ncbi:MAG: hypothetical protein WAK53_02000 [Chromatiaceae bacterium]|jgi:hypothetical protein